MAPESKPNPLRRFLTPALLVAAMVLIAQYGSRHFDTIETWIGSLGWIGPVVFTAIYVILVSLCFPVSALGISAGLLFGFTRGALLLTADGILTGCIIFLLARRFLRARILRYIASHPRLAAFERLARARSLRLMLLLRLSPLNYGVVCYLLGANKVRFRDYAITLLAIIPSALIQCYIGYAAGRLGSAAGQTAEGSRLQNIWTVVGIVFCLLLAGIIGQLAKRAIQEVQDAPEDTNESST